MRKIYLLMFFLLLVGGTSLAQRVISPPVQKPISSVISPKIQIPQPKVPVTGIPGIGKIPLLMVVIDNGGGGGGGGGGGATCNAVSGQINGGGGVVCPGNNSTQLQLVGYTGTPQWYSSTDNVNFDPISNATGDTYTATNLTVNTYFAVQVTYQGCTIYSARVEVTMGSVTWVLDADKDGYYVGPPVTQCDSPGSGWVILSTQQPGDCDDSDPSVHASFSFYADNDKDGFGAGSLINGICAVDQNSPPVGYSTNNTDCNDNDPTVWRSVTLYTDNDGDGYYGTQQQGVCIGEVPAGFTLSSFGPDCDDNNVRVHSPITGYLDLDHDGHGDPATAQQFCSTILPKGYVSIGDDCDDDDPTVYPGAPEICDGKDNNCNGQIDEGLAQLTFYRDADGDGYGDPNISIVSCSAPPGYVADNTDCNDNDASIHATVSWVLDADNDGHYVGSPVMQCGSPGIGWTQQTSQQAGDCDDNDPNVWQSATLYVDHDGDGYDAGTTTVCYGATIPLGYSTTTKGSDCNDNDASVWQSATLYIDHDGDGYDGGQQTVCYGATLPPGYSLTSKGSDCNDNDASVWQSATLYIDADGDGYDAGTTTVCYGATIPSGYSTTTKGSDCNDNDPLVHVPLLYYVDNDHDHYGSATIAMLCVSSPPVGFSTNNTDCNDNDPNVWQSGTLYIDHDGDGYSAGTATVCYGASIPNGYSLTSKGSDCDDNNAMIHNAAIAGNITGATSVCPGINSTTLTISGNVGVIQWQSSLNNTVFNNIIGARNQTYTATNLSTTTYYRAVVSDGSCVSVTTASVAITMGILQNATSMTTTNIASTSAVLNWVSTYNPAQWQIEYKSTAPGSPWIDLAPQAGSVRSVPITKLQCSTNYQWHIRDNCGKMWTAYSNATTFKTLACGSTLTINQPVNIPETIQELQVRAMPNPTNTNFTIMIKGNSQNGMIKMFVVDMYGRMIEERMLPNEQTIMLGDNYKPGVYLVKLIQGEQNKELKLIKLPN